MKSREWIKKIVNLLSYHPQSRVHPHTTAVTTPSPAPSDLIDCGFCENETKATVKQISDVENEPEIGR